MSMFSHVMLGTNDIARAKTFYDALFASVGGPEGFVDSKGRLVYVHKDSAFLLSVPINGKPATGGNGATLGFTMDNPEQVEAWHRAGAASGGTAIEDPPGERSSPFGPLYLAYLLDPDGNKICAMHRMEQS